MTTVNRGPHIKYLRYATVCKIQADLRLSSEALRRQVCGRSLETSKF
jgi:hypothetical protein